MKKKKKLSAPQLSPGKEEQTFKENPTVYKIAALLEEKRIAMEIGKGYNLVRRGKIAARHVATSTVGWIKADDMAARGWADTSRCKRKKWY